jgi:hypothetical protein
VAYHKIRQPKVYIPSKSFHNFNDAKRFGDLVFCTEGTINREDVQNITRLVVTAMEDCEAGDYIMISGLSVINSIMCALFAGKHKRINFLLFDDDTQTYISRKIVLSEVIDKGRTNDSRQSKDRR